MNKTQIKELAQDLILQNVAVAYYKVEAMGLDADLPPDELEALNRQLRQQGDRVARLFGYREQVFTG